MCKTLPYDCTLQTFSVHRYIADWVSEMEMTYSVSISSSTSSSMASALSADKSTEIKM